MQKTNQMIDPRCFSSERKEVRTWRLLACTVAMCGIQVCYAAQINLGTSELLLLGLSQRTVSLAWLAGPLSGLIVQPIVGLASDACRSRFGRRRPFLVIGTLFTATALLIFSNSTEIAEKIFPGKMVRPIALNIAIIAFFLLDFSIQAIQGPLRALVTDVIPGSQRAEANAYVGFFTGLGNFLGGSLTATELNLYFSVFKTNVQAVFGVAAIILCFTVSICVVFTKEEVLHDRTTPQLDSNAPLLTETVLQADNHVYSSIREIGDQDQERSFFTALREIPTPFWQVFSIQLCTWCGFFTMFVYLTAWVGSNVYGGVGNSPRGSAKRDAFERGVRLGGKGSAITAIVTILYSYMLPGILNMFGTVGTYAISQIVEAACLLSAPLIRGSSGISDPSDLLKFVTLLDIGAFGIVWATTMGVPWTLIGDALDSDEWYRKRIGLFTTIFNASQSFPQLVVAFAAPLILKACNDDLSYVMFTGGIFALFGAFILCAVSIGVAEDPALKLKKRNAIETSSALSRVYGRYEEGITPNDFVDIFQKNFEKMEDLSSHAAETASWLS